MKDFNYSILDLKKLENAFDLLFEFNKNIKIYQTEDEMIKTINKFLSLGNPTGIIYKGKLIAYYNLYCNNTETYEAYFGNLYVLENYRRRGLAKELVLSAIEYAKKQKFERIILHVSKKNIAAIKLYESVHFEFTGNTTVIRNKECYEMSIDLGAKE